MLRRAIPSSIPLRVPTGLVLLALALQAGGPGRDAARAQSQPASPPCKPSFTRSMAPLAIEQGDAAEVAVAFDYDCRDRGEQVAINVMLVINTAVPNGFSDRAGLERNLRAGLGSIVNQLPWEKDSTMGMVLFDHAAQVRSPLRADPDGTGGHRQALAQLAQSLRLGVGSASGFDQAVSLAFRQLPVHGSPAQPRRKLHSVAARPVAPPAPARPRAPGHYTASAMRRRAPRTRAGGRSKR